MRIFNKEKNLELFKSKLKSIDKTVEADEKPSVKMLFIIVEGGHSDEVVQVLFEAGIRFDFMCKGIGTADSNILNMLGLGTSVRDVILTSVESSKANHVIELIYDVFKMSGIVFSVRLKSIGGRNILKLMQGEC